MAAARARRRRAAARRPARRGERVARPGRRSSPPEREFLAGEPRPRAARARDAPAAARELIIGALATGLVAITAVALVAIDQRRDAERTRNVARSQALALQSAQTLDTDPQLALRLACGPTTHADDRSTSALRQAVLAQHQLGAFPADPLTADRGHLDPRRAHRHRRRRRRRDGLGRAHPRAARPPRRERRQADGGALLPRREPDRPGFRARGRAHRRVAGRAARLLRPAPTRSTSPSAPSSRSG